MSLIRRRIAERLVEAQQQAALLTTFNEIDMSAVNELRAAYREQFQEKYGIKLGFMSFFVKAVDRRPQGSSRELNAEIRDTNIVYRHYYHIGIAIGSTKGLVVPVLRFAERLSFAEIEQAIDDFAQRAAKNKLEAPTSSKAARSRSPTAASSARCSPRRSSTHRKAASSACTPSRTGPSPAKARSSSAR